MDFDLTPYTDLRNALAQNGIKCGVNGRHQITVSVQDRAILPDAGNSFWVTVATGSWCLFTWVPVGYRVPGNADVPELCRRCMAIGSAAMYRVPKEICDDFGLTELGAEEIDAVFAAMKTAR